MTFRTYEVIGLPHFLTRWAVVTLTTQTTNSRKAYKQNKRNRENNFLDREPHCIRENEESKGNEENSYFVPNRLVIASRS